MSEYERIIADYEALAQKVYDHAKERAADLFGGGSWGLATAFRNAGPEEITALEVTPEGIHATAYIWTSTTGGSQEHVEWTVPFEALEVVR